MGSIQEEWLIYFHSRGTQKYAKWIWWWKPKPGFSHCGALKYIPDLDVWEHIEFTHAGIKTSYLNKQESKEFLNYLYDFEILVCPVKDDWHLFRIKELSCVSFIMRLIGFYRWYIITPWQLYCALRKQGYKRFWSKTEFKKELL
jgi:hypothetical protein